jgi:FkbM family methyltransferase
MKILSQIQFITSHPLNKDRKLKSIVRLFKWQVSSRLNPYPVIYPFTEKSKLIIKKGMTGATGNLYCGLHEYNDMSFLLHVLREGDLFVDVGANIGSYTVLASAHVGADTISFEPVPSTYANLVQNISVNQVQQKATALNIGLGSSKGKIGFNTDSFDTMHHVAEANEPVSIEVPIERLDDVLQNKRVPLLIKIDVEGFETEVLKGAGDTLKQQALKAIIVELNGAGSRYGYDERKIHQSLLDHGFKACYYEPKSRRLEHATSIGSYNTIYVRDEKFIQERLTNAPLIRIFDKEL